FPRLWFVVDEQNKKEFKTIEINSEAPLYISFISAFFFTIFILLAFIQILEVQIISKPFVSVLIWEKPPNFTLLGIIALLVSVLSYYISLPLHLIRGEYFKALFDIYRTKAEDLMSLSQSPIGLHELTTLRDKWAYLQYMFIICPVCG